MPTQTQVLAERAVQLGFTYPPTYINPLSPPIGHEDLMLRRVPARGDGPLRLTLIPNVDHLDRFAPLDIPLDGEWQPEFGEDGLWARASSKCHPAKTQRGEQTCVMRCVQVMELVITITHVESGQAISAGHPYSKDNRFSLRPTADAQGVEVCERVRQQLLDSSIDWDCDATMLPMKRAAKVAAEVWAPEVSKLLKAERASAAEWRKTLSAMAWPKNEREKEIFEAECRRFFWRRFRK